jgi:hypothetical protein
MAIETQIKVQSWRLQIFSPAIAVPPQAIPRMVDLLIPVCVMKG